LCDVAAALRRFDPGAVRILEAAEQRARQAGHAFLGVEHVLWASLREPAVSGRLPAAATAGLALALEPFLQADYGADPAETLFLSPRLYGILTKDVLRVADRDRRRQVRGDDLLIAILEEGDHAALVCARQQRVDLVSMLDALCQPELQAIEIPQPIRGWCRDLTARMMADGATPVISGDREKKLVEALVRQLADSGIGVASRSPLLIGDSGVGKTAVVELLAQQLGKDELKRLGDAHVIAVDIHKLHAGTIYHGMWEDRLTQTLRFATENRSRVILFIDELHAMVGAGTTVGRPHGMEQALLAALGRGEFRLVGATTTQQYQEIIERDEALRRRFRTVPVEEASVEETRALLQGLSEMLQGRAQMTIQQRAVDRVLELAAGYLRSRRLPGKAIQWLQNACEQACYHDSQEVTPDDVVDVVSEELGLPKWVLARDFDAFDDVEEALASRVKGQDHVREQIVRRLRLNYSAMAKESRSPTGVFLFLGPSGVGKTELARALAESLLGDEDRMLRLNMSQYASGDPRTELLGHPRSRKRGALNRVRAHPYTVLLLDEFEKAHPSVWHLFLDIFDEGWTVDAEGEIISFTDTIIIATSNLGVEQYDMLGEIIGFPASEPEDDFEKVREQVEESLVRMRMLPAPLKGRFDRILAFNPLDQAIREAIVVLWLDEFAQRVRRCGRDLAYDPEVPGLIARQPTDPTEGARGLRRWFEQNIEEEVAAVGSGAGPLLRLVAGDGTVAVRTEKRTEARGEERRDADLA